MVAAGCLALCLPLVSTWTVPGSLSAPRPARRRGVVHASASDALSLKDAILSVVAEGDEEETWVRVRLDFEPLRRDAPVVEADL